MRYQRLGLCGVCAVLVIQWVFSSRAFEAAQTDASMAVLRGKIRFIGTVPAPNRLNMAPDPVCMQFVNSSENVQVNDQGLENVMVYVSSPVPSSAPSTPIRDDVHRWKAAYVGVFSHPYHTVSKAGGLYELRLPPGSYEITVWHEQYGKSQQSVTVGTGENPALDFVYSAP